MRGVWVKFIPLFFRDQDLAVTQLGLFEDALEVVVGVRGHDVEEEHEEDAELAAEQAREGGVPPLHRHVVDVGRLEQCEDHVGPADSHHGL